MLIDSEKVAVDGENVLIASENLLIEAAIDSLNASQGTIAKAKAVFANMGADGVFGQALERVNISL